MVDKVLIPEVLQKLSDDDLLSCLESSSILFDIISNERFWMTRLGRRFPWFLENRPKDVGSKDFYISLIKSIRKVFKKARIGRKPEDETCLETSDLLMIRVSSEGHLLILRYLIEKCKASTNIYNEWPLRVASEGGHLEVVKYLVEKCGSNPHVENEWALVYASRNVGHLPLVQYLIEECKSNPHIDDEMPLREAIEWGHLLVVKYLVEKCGANYHIQENKPLRLAIANDHVEIIEYLKSLP